MKKILLFVILSVSGAALFAQSGIDPTVVVSNNFAASVASGAKLPYFPVTPDGVKTFDIKFDYSVFPTVYLGAYDFSPYQIEMHPAFEQEKSRHLYFKVGAGYTLHPELEFAYSPVIKTCVDSTGRRRGQLSMNIFAGHNSYYGDYHVFDAYNGGKYTAGDGYLTTKGYDLASNFGVALNYETLKMVTTLFARWDNISYRNSRLAPMDGGDLSREYSRIDNALDVYWDIASRRFAGQKFEYKLKLAYNLYDDIYKTRPLANSVALAADKSLTEHDMTVNFEFGPVFKNRSRLLIGLKAEEIYASALNHTEYFRIHPHYVFSKGRFDLDLGVSVEYIKASNGHEYAVSDGGTWVYPAAKAQFTLVKHKTFLYLIADGGNTPARISDIMGRYRFFDCAPLYSVPATGSLKIRNEIIPIHAKVGLKGDLAQIIDYNVYGCFGKVNCGLLWKSADGEVGFPLVTYGEYMCWGAGVDFAFNYKSFKAFAQFAYNGTDILKRYRQQDVFAPAQFKAYLELRYNFSERIYIAATCDFASAQKASSSVQPNGQEFLKVPAYQNLGFRAEFKTRRNIGFYIKANNLLAQPIQYVPFISEKGVSVIGGMVLTL